MRRKDGFHRHLNLTRTKAIGHDVNHGETFTDEEPLHKLSGPNANRRCPGFGLDGVASKTKKLTAQAATMEVAPDNGHVRSATPSASMAQPPQGQPSLSGPLLLIEIPYDFLALKAVDLSLARAWRFYTRAVFEQAFAAGYLVTDFVHDQGRSFYVLAHGETTL